MEYRDVAHLGEVLIGEPVKQPRIAGVQMGRQDGGTIFAGKRHHGGLPWPLHQPAVAPYGKAAGGENDDGAVFQKGLGGQSQRFLGLGMAAIPFAPFHRHDHVGKTRIDANRVAVGEKRQVVAHPLERIIDGNPVSDAGRMVDRHDESARFGDSVEPGDIEIEIEDAADKLHCQGGTERLDLVGHGDGFAVVQNAVQKRPDDGPGPAADQFLTPFGDQIIDDMDAANGARLGVLGALRRRLKTGPERNGARLADVADIRHNRKSPVGDNRRRTCQKPGQVIIAPPDVGFVTPA